MVTKCFCFFSKIPYIFQDKSDFVLVEGVYLTLRKSKVHIYFVNKCAFWDLSFLCEHVFMLHQIVFLVLLKLRKKNRSFGEIWKVQTTKKNTKTTKISPKLWKKSKFQVSKFISKSIVIVFGVFKIHFWRRLRRAKYI